jgi:hypothetical protein
LTETENLQQEIDKLKTRLSDVQYYATCIIRDNTEPDKVYIHADKIIGICGDFGGLTTKVLMEELKKLKGLTNHV